MTALPGLCPAVIKPRLQSHTAGIYSAHTTIMPYNMLCLPVGLTVVSQMDLMTTVEFLQLNSSNTEVPLMNKKILKVFR